MEMYVNRSEKCMRADVSVLYRNRQFDSFHL